MRESVWLGPRGPAQFPQHYGNPCLPPSWASFRSCSQNALAKTMTSGGQSHAALVGPSQMLWKAVGKSLKGQGGPCQLCGLPGGGGSPSSGICREAMDMMEMSRDLGGPERPCSNPSSALSSCVTLGK